jgi:chromosome segregation and condensation protein ScpB
MQADSRTQRAVIALVLYEHPTALTANDLAREVGDDAEQAVAQLLADGLLRRDGEVIRATVAAISFDQLDSSS